MATDDLTRRRLRRWAVAAIAAVIVGVAGVGATYTPLFAATRISVLGAGSISRRAVLDVGGVDRGSNVFHLDTGVVVRRLEGDPRILSARVTTSLPNGLRIEITRRVPVAVVGTPPELVGADGIVIGSATTTTGLPLLISAEGDPATGTDLATVARVAAAMPPSLRLEVEAVTIDRDGLLAVRLSAGFSAEFGDASALRAKAASLAALLRWVEQQGVAVVSADLSVPGSPTAALRHGRTSVPIT